MDYIEKQNRQRVNLSNNALSVIKADQIFLPKKWQSTSGYINAVFEEYYEHSNASIGYLSQKYKDGLVSTLSNLRKKNPQTVDSVIDKLTNEYYHNLSVSMKDYPSENPKVIIRLNDHVYDLLYNPPLPDIETYNGAGRYLKAVIEDFVDKPLYIREEVYFSEIYNRIENAISLSQCLVLKYSSGVTDCSATLQNGVNHIFKPYKIIVDKERQCTYCVGYAHKKKEAGSKKREEPFKPFSFKLSRIKNIRPINRPSGKLTHEEQNILESIILSRGILYLDDEPEDITIRFSPYGKNLYNSISHQRPNIIEEACDGKFTICRFRCPAKQAENYFFKFGNNIEVMNPPKLRNWFKNSYKKAYDLYDE